MVESDLSDEDFIKELNHKILFPRPRLSEDEKSAIRQNLRRYKREELDNLPSNFSHSSPMTRKSSSRMHSYGRVFVGLAGVALLAVVIAGIHGMTNETTASSESKHAVSKVISERPKYFGVRLPFAPVVPRQVLRGYKLTASSVDMDLKQGATHFEQYVIEYENQTAPFPKRFILMIEKSGNSLKVKDIPGNGALIPWQKSIVVGSTTYHFSHEFSTGNIIGFVRNHRVCVLDGYGMSDSTLLSFAESMTSTESIPIRYAQRTANGSIQDAMKNVHSDAVIPASLHGKYKIVGVSSTVDVTPGHQDWGFGFGVHIWNSPKRFAQIGEVPLAEVSHSSSNQTSAHMTPQTNYTHLEGVNHKRGLEVTVIGNLSKTALEEILHACVTA